MTFSEDLVFVMLFINSISAIYYLIKYPLASRGILTNYERFSLALAFVSGFWLLWLIAKLFRLKKGFVNKLFEDEDLKPRKKFKHVKVTPEEIHINFRTTSGKKVKFKAIKPKEEVKIK